MLNSFKKFYKNLFKDQLFIIKASGKVDYYSPEARENLIANIKELTSKTVLKFSLYMVEENLLMKR